MLTVMLSTSLRSQALVPPSFSGFDVLLLSDLLHFHNSHGAILASLRALLARTAGARAYVAAGTYTPPHVCAAFVRLAQEQEISGGDVLVVEEGPADDQWKGNRSVASGGVWLDVNDLGIRKGMCRWWTVCWSEKVLASGKRS